MGIAPSIRNTVRNAITTYGSTVSLYSYSDATVTTNDEGEDTAITWGSASPIKVISSNHSSYKKLAERFGIETDDSARTFLAKDNITVAAKDKLTVGTDSYEITGIKKIDPIENTNFAFILSVAKNEVY